MRETLFLHMQNMERECLNFKLQLWPRPANHSHVDSPTH